MPEPVFVALLIADRVITEDNQKKGIIGTFTQFTVRQVPAALPPWFIYAAVTNVVGEHTLFPQPAFRPQPAGDLFRRGESIR